MGSNSWLASRSVKVEEQQGHLKEARLVESRSSVSMRRRM